MLDTLGGMVDNLFLAVPRVLLPFKPKTHVMDRAAYEASVDFYIDRGYTGSPASFFALPDRAPAYQLAEETPYHEGMCQFWTYSSRHEPRNPNIRDRYLAHTNNHTGWLVRWTHSDRPRPTVLCLHGYMLGEPQQAWRMFNIQKLFDRGLDVALFVTPFHWRRAPTNKAERGIFLQPDNVAMTAECVGHAMHDLAATCHILTDLGTEQIGLIGASLGGYNAALFAGLSDRPAFIAMMVPAINFSAPFGPTDIKLPYAVGPDLADKIQRVWTFHSPLNLRPRIDTEDILVIAARGDKLCPYDHTLALCRQWHLNRCHFLTGGHWLVFNNRRRGAAWYQFLEQKGFGANH
ncbi:MAG: YqiA/YcfP family alpha/beta fold hydrolase [Thermodesulfobacteriota bacterium]|nr:YqiA/YcfP family alpha/beta fold hydrolase [Thermodesulfobacteriota bacterium]